MQILTAALALGTVLTINAGVGEGQEPSSSGWSLSEEPVLLIGEMDGSDHYLFQSIVGAATLPGGEIAVADDGFKVVRVYDSTGAFLREMGGSGAGPGDFLWIRGMWTRPGGTIGVLDPQQLRVTRFAADGDVVASNRLLPPPQGDLPSGATLQTFLGVFSDGSVGVGWLAFGGEIRAGSTVSDRYVLGRFSDDGSFLGVIGEERFFDRALFSSGRGGPVAFSAIPHAAVHNDSLYFADGTSATVEVRDREGTIARTIALPFESPDVDRTLAELEPRLSAEGPFNTPEQLAGSPRPTSIPVVSGLLVDESGFIWVRRYAVPDDSLWLAGSVERFGGDWLVLDSDGSPRADLRLPDGFRPLAIERDRILGVQVDEFEVQRFAVYELNRGR